MGEYFFWYWPTRVVPDKRLLNSCVCVCVTYLLTGSYLVTGLDWLTFSKAEDLDCSLKPSERL